MGKRICADGAAQMRRRIKDCLEMFGRLSYAPDVLKSLKNWADDDAEMHTGNHFLYGGGPAVVDGKIVKSKRFLG